METEDGGGSNATFLCVGVMDKEGNEGGLVPRALVAVTVNVTCESLDNA